jgi:PAS domain S-box-containing protein
MPILKDSIVYSSSRRHPLLHNKDGRRTGEKRRTSVHAGKAAGGAAMQRGEKRRMGDSTEYLRAIPDCVGDPIFVKDRHHRLVFVNDAACEMFGKPRGQLVGKTDDELLPKEHADVFRKADDSVFETGKKRVDEEQITDAQGNVRRIITKRTLCGSEAGEKYLIGTIRDITERKHMEKAVEESEEQFRKMFEGSLLGMLMAGADFRIIRANEAFCGMIGYTEEELALLTFKDITHPAHIVEDTLRVNDLLSGKISLYRTEKQYIRKDKG